MAVEYLGILYGLDDVSLQSIFESLQLYHQHHGHQHQQHHHGRHQGHPDQDLHHQAEAWVGLMKEADDGDGSLSYEEFVAMIKKAQKEN